MSGGSSVGADVLRLPAARAKSASRGRVGRARHVSRQHDPPALAAHVRRLDRDGGEERLRVRVHRRLVDLLARPDLDDLAQVHHGDAIRDVADDRQVVGDEEVREPELVLELGEQVDDLRLNRDVERRHRLVQDHQLRVQGKRASDADPLALAPGELVRKAVRVLGAEPDGAQKLLHPARALRLAGRGRGYGAARRRCRERSFAD